MYPTDEFVSCLPLAWVGEQMLSISGALLIGFTVNFPEEPTTVQDNIREAVVFGKDNPHVTAFINKEFENVAKWAENQQITYTTYTDLSQKPKVYELIKKDVEKVNEQLPQAARIKRFVILHKELDADDQELTRTLKVRREFVD